MTHLLRENPARVRADMSSRPINSSRCLRTVFLKSKFSIWPRRVFVSFVFKPLRLYQRGSDPNPSNYFFQTSSCRRKIYHLLMTTMSNGNVHTYDVAYVWIVEPRLNSRYRRLAAARRKHCSVLDANAASAKVRNRMPAEGNFAQFSRS